jgi:acyl dehydratase
VEQTETTWPQALTEATGPFAAARLHGAAEGMGPYGPGAAAVAAQGMVPPDLITGMTLFLLARQPRRGDGRPPSGVSGGVWVQERFTMHRPLAATDPFVVRGEITGRYVRKGRRYSTTRSRSHDSAGRLVATNLTTGLVAYRAEEGLADEVEGLALDETPAPQADWEAAGSNPHADRLAGVVEGQRFGGDPVTVSWAMMAARDTAQPENPIHSDLEAARAAGLERPIAGGSHVLAFALDPLLAAWGPESLSHGTSVNARWKAPTAADATIVPTATVSLVEADRIEVDLDVVLEGSGGTTAMVATIVVPLPA